MDFVAVMLFTRSLYQVFQLECLILLIIEIIIILNQISAWSCLSKFFYKKAYNILSQSSKKGERTLPHKIIFSSSGISLGQYCQKILTKSGVFRKNKKRRDGDIVGAGGVYRQGIKPSTHYALKCFKRKLCDKSWI